MSAGRDKMFCVDSLRSERRAPQTGRACFWLAAFLCVVCAAVGAQAQQDRPAASAAQIEHAPPPMKYIPANLRQQLAAETDPKKRMRLSLTLAEERLASAEQLSNADKYEAAANELGIYEALVYDAIRYLHQFPPRSNKTRDLFKRFEMAVRSHLSRIETIRRATPSEHVVHVRDVLERVRDARTQALESFYDNTVLRDEPAKDKPDEDEPAQTETNGAARSASPPASDKKPAPR
jgi:hypothetical protein